ncbi:MAG: CBS domain-containing protein [Planctomycetes bacterium]|jgi:Kef-type K+ transport system membrane component KefB|nr:CBS domain-containing protein [Planctomycetota bacterium]
MTLAQLNIHHLPILLIVGFALFAGGLGARLFQRLRIPQVVGYIIIGVILGRSGFGLVSDEAIAQMRLFNLVALGMIGFMIGGELRLDVFRRHGRRLMTILLAEGLSAFVLVSPLTFGVTFLFTRDLAVSSALGIVLGAISSATAPAATVDVLWEYKTRGPVTTAVFAIVALDDGLALVLYGMASSVAGLLIGSNGGRSLAESLGWTAWELLGAVLLGVIGGFVLNSVLRLARDHDKALTFILGALVVVLGVAMAAALDVILAAMALGMTVVNLAPRRTRETFNIVERFAPPIYVLFFVIVGARLSVGDMKGWMWALAAAYVLGRTGGKMLGAYLGARWAGAAETLRQYLGLCLFSQAGVAIGLAIMASETFPPAIGNAVALIVTATTFLVQLVGPPCVKVAVSRAGEVGMNVTRENLVKLYNVGNVMSREPVCITENAPYHNVCLKVRETDATVYPVVDAEQRLLGVVTVDGLKASLGRDGMADLVVASDLMQPVDDTVAADTPLANAMQRMSERELDYLAVIEPTDDGPPRLLGLLERRAADRFLSRELLRREEAAVDQEQSQLLRDAIRRKSGRKPRAPS